MKKFAVVLAMLCALLMVVSAAAFAGSTDVKYYQDQSANWGQGVIDSCSTEVGVKHQTQANLTVEGKGFGAVDIVPCTGILGVGQMDLSITKTNTITCGLYTQAVHQISLAGSVEMNQLGGLASFSAGGYCIGLAGSGGHLSQNQTLNLSAIAALPSGLASHSYTGTQIATIGGGSF